MGTVDNGSPLHALKGNYRLTELLFKKHVLPEAEAISLHEAAENGDIRGVCLVLNWTMASVDTKGEYVSAYWSAGADGAVCRDTPHSFGLHARVTPRLPKSW